MAGFLENHMHSTAFYLTIHFWVAFGIVAFATGHWVAGIAGGGLAAVMILDGFRE